MNFEEKGAVVTGGISGIGLAVARRLVVEANDPSVAKASSAV